MKVVQVVSEGPISGKTKRKVSSPVEVYKLMDFLKKADSFESANNEETIPEHSESVNHRSVIDKAERNKVLNYSKKELSDIKNKFEELRQGFKCYVPKGFERLACKYMDLYQNNKGFQQTVHNKWKKQGLNPCREWLKIHNMSLDDGEVRMLIFFRALKNEESRRTYLALVSRYVIKLRNSAAFKLRCNNFRKIGINPFQIFMSEAGFNCEFDQAVIDKIKMDLCE